jgi:2-polyprenyl-3-methyl-5-hydroxy-6-metoxy-1,4-benzoquinol methylase
MDTPQLDPAARLADLALGHVLVSLIGLGHRIGLLDALAAGPATADELAARAGADPRYVREWLGGLVGGRVVEWTAEDGRYRFAPGYAGVLSGATTANVAPTAEMLTRLTAMVPEVAERFRDGAGIPAATYAQRAAGSLGGSRRILYDEQLVPGFLGAVPGLHDRLRDGAAVLDVGCGPGQVARLIADAFPASRVTGVDVVAEAIEQARAAAGDRPNLDYRVGDAALLGEDGRFDVVLALDVVHDLGRPREALRGMHQALVPGGVLVMVDIAFSADLDEVAGNPGATQAFGVSVLHCLPMSLHDGGAGLGAMWGREAAQRMLEETGFTDVRVHPSPRPQNAVYVATR